MATVIAQMNGGNGPDLLGVREVENRSSIQIGYELVTYDTLEALHVRRVQISEVLLK